jgi:carbon-monoxide dehydrogenase small subunit
MKIKLTVNKRIHEVHIDPGEMLLDVLRRLGYKSVRRSCNSASCGNCTVLLEGKPILSCITFAASVDNCSIETVEYLSEKEELHPIQEAILEAGGSQCGYCISGLTMTIKSFLAENPDPDDEEIKKALVGNLCRCTGYESQIKAVKLAAKKLRGEKR